MLPKKIRLFKKNELKYLWPFYLVELVMGLSVMIAPFYFIYFRKLGFSYFQISVITSSLGFSMFLFEIPTGAFADGYSRKYSVVLGSLINSVTISLISITTNFHLIVLLQIFTGIATTFISGAAEAWVIDNLSNEGRKDLHQEFFIKSNIFIALGAIFAPILGNFFVVNDSLKLLWCILGAGYFCSAIIYVFFTKEHFTPSKFKRSEIILKSYKNCKLGLRFSIRNKEVLFFILGGLCVQMMMLGRSGMQPFLVSLGMPENHLGYLFSIISLACIITSLLSRYLTKFKPTNIISIIIIVVIGLFLSLLFISSSDFLIVAIIFITTCALFELGTPLIQTYFHNFIPVRIRSTVLSTRSMATQLILGCSTLVGGALLDLFGPQKVLAYGSLFGLLAIFLFQKISD